MKLDQTPTESVQALRDLLEEIGPSADATAFLGISENWREPCILVLKPGGTTHHTQIRTEGDTWAEAIELARAQWAERRDQHAINVIRSMALRIIAITMDNGECTDAALRAEFDVRDVKRYGDQACAQATEMGGRGPFRIVSVEGSNDK